MHVCVCVCVCVCWQFLQLSINHPSNQYLVDDWQQSQQQQYTHVQYRIVDDEEGEDVPDNQPVT
jgi:hypothetical protein